MNEIRTMRARAVPLIGIESQDNAATVNGCIKALNGKVESFPVLEWDIARGWFGRNQPGSDWLKKELDDSRVTLGEALAIMAKGIPGGSLVFIHNAQRVLERDGVAQGVWLCRDAFKSKRPAATLVLLGPSLPLPGELASDVVMLSQKPPNGEEIGAIVDDIYSAIGQSAKAAGSEMPALDDSTRKAAVAAGLGLLSRFDVEQTVALAVSREGLDVQEIWKRKIARIKLQSGAEIWTGCPDFSALAGCANIKDFLKSYINGRRPPGVVLFLDEIEKMVAGAGTDSSGVTGKMLGQFLSWTQDRMVDGVLLLGVPGAGKSATAKCCAGEAKVPCFRLSMSEAQGSLVGQSEANLKAALASVDAISGGKVLMLATCNSIEALAPELMGRFRLGTFFYDFPNADENAALWDMYCKRYSLGVISNPPKSVNWVGREIESACYQAWLFNKPLSEVVKYVVPECVSQKGKLNALRESVSGRFLSASKAGIYRADSEDLEGFEPAGRSVTV